MILTGYGSVTSTVEAMRLGRLESPSRRYAPGLQRLFSPCCYRETLDVHSSPIADELRIEIHERLGRGESPDGVLADMVSRYGDDVLTKPPRTLTALALFAGAALFVTGLIAFALRHARRTPPPPVPPSGLGLPPEEERQLEDRLADELSALE
ncbi:MAG TPA: cytochrome c-type biogenesis protein CcmH [Polyangia bacterium]|nr:cytochrome c-type biogenesis protein CcmH [Polyangia bacterium]